MHETGLDLRVGQRIILLDRLAAGRQELAGRHDGRLRADAQQRRYSHYPSYYVPFEHFRPHQINQQ
jgi:hypothetical protein